MSGTQAARSLAIRTRMSRASSLPQPASGRNDGRALRSSEGEHGGRGEIRTHGELSPTPVFKTGAINHSATLPAGKKTLRETRPLSSFFPGGREWDVAP